MPDHDCAHVDELRTMISQFQELRDAHAETSSNVRSLMQHLLGNGGKGIYQRLDAVEEKAKIAADYIVIHGKETSEILSRLEQDKRERDERQQRLDEAYEIARLQRVQTRRWIIGTVIGCSGAITAIVAVIL